MAGSPEAFDFVVVGAGCAGSVLARRLAESRDSKVLLLEAGGNARTPFIAMPAGNGFLFGNPRYDWGYASVPQPGLSGREIYFPRGKGLGGSTILNGMIYIRGHRSDYDRWAQSGLAGWSYAELLPYFLRAESSRHRNDAWHGTAGPLVTCPAGNFTRLDRIFIEAARAAGCPFNVDFNGADQRGVGRLDVTVADGRRQSVARAYLHRHPPNLTVRTGQRVIGIEFESQRAVGVRVASREGRYRVRANREIVCCLGAFGSPQLLMLSGVGPAPALRMHDLGVVADIEGVGKSLRDHLNVPVQYRCRDEALSFARYQRLDRALWIAARWLLDRSGPAAAPFWSTCAFDGDRPGEAASVLQIFFTPMVVTEAPDGDGEPAGTLLERLGHRIFVRGSKRAVSGFQLDINLMRPASVGEVRLASADPMVPPHIDPRFLSDSQDLSELLAGVRRVREIVGKPAFDAVRGDELSPGRTISSDADLADSIRRSANTGHHPVGTCRMAPEKEPLGVVDAEFRVRGVQGLRVCDASVFPDQITGNPQAVIVAMAEKAADLILGRPPLPPYLHSERSPSCP